MTATQLRTTQLGRTGLEITRVGFGAWAIGGGGWEFGWGPQDDEESIGAIHRALDLGVNWIDTAAAYGFGRSEQVVGRALQGLAERPFVFTKCSLVEGPGRTVRHSLKRNSILREAEASLTRLGVDAIDLYQIHWPDPEEYIQEGWAALAELKEQGLVRHIGVSNFDVDQLRRIQQITPVETLQPPYSLIERNVEDEILPYTRREGIGVIAYSPMGSGMLTGGMTPARVESLAEDDWRKQDPRRNRGKRAMSTIGFVGLGAMGSRIAGPPPRRREPGEVADRVRSLGAEMLDAPVSGSIPQAESGTLAIIVGGDEPAFAKVEPLLHEFGQTVTHIGDNGQGLALKLAINISHAVQVLAFGEGLLLAERDGIDPKLAADVMAATPIGSPMLTARIPLLLDLPEDAWFDVAMMQKDIRLALEAADELAIPLPSAAVANGMLTRASELGYEHRDLAALHETLAHSPVA